MSGAESCMELLPARGVSSEMSLPGGTSEEAPVFASSGAPAAKVAEEIVYAEESKCPEEAQA